ncbi:MAG: hypothetical protein ACREM2_01550 [Vulcanimicrobiaceae bacterium]
MSIRPPLSVLLSQTLIAYTIEFDNEAERRIAAADSGRRCVVSLVMWANFMQFVGEDGVSVESLEARGGMCRGSFRACLTGLERWGYIAVSRPSAVRRSGPSGAGWLVRATDFGRRAQELWRPLASALEQRWAERFGADELERLRTSLRALVDRLEFASPPYLPVVTYGNGMRAGVALDRPRQAAWAASDLELYALLSALLLALTIEFERPPRHRRGGRTFTGSSGTQRHLEGGGQRVARISRTARLYRNRCGLRPANEARSPHGKRQA